MRGDCIACDALFSSRILAKRDNERRGWGGGGGGEVVKGSNIQQTLGKKEINCLLAEAIKLPLVKIYCLGKEVISIEPEAI